MYYYYYYTQKYPDDIIVYVEEINKEENYIIVDFIDNGQHRNFTSNLNFNIDSENSSFILVKNYFPRKRIQENTAYTIKKETLLLIKENISLYGEDSSLIKYQIDLTNIEEKLFSNSVSLTDIEKNTSDLPLSLPKFDINWKSNNIKAVVRNVGLANWNELVIDDEVKIVFDIGAPTLASREKVRALIGTKIIEYTESKPILILSHWDKDHYHSLLTMTNEEISCFSKFICINRTVTNTAEVVLNKIIDVLGSQNVYRIANRPRISKGGVTPLYLLSQVTDQYLLFNSMYHKNKNISGLVLAIRTSTSSVIYSGDCCYYQLSNYVLPHLNYDSSHKLIVPHHGGNAGKYIYEASKITKKESVISSGPSTNHPSKYNSENLRNDFSNVKLTKVTLSDITINL